MYNHKQDMIQVYSETNMANIVAAGGNVGFMNLGFDPQDGKSYTSQEKQLLMVKHIMDILSPKPNELVMDLGCGKGGTISFLKEYYKIKKIIGINIDPYQLMSAKELLNEKGLLDGVQFLEHDLEKKFEENFQADKIYGIEILTHISDKAQFAIELSKQLKHHGIAVMAFSCLKRNFEEYGYDEQKFMRDIAVYFRENPEDFKTVDYYIDLFEKFGLKIISKKMIGDQVFQHRHEEFVYIYNMLNSTDEKKKNEAISKWCEMEHCQLDYLNQFLKDNIRYNQRELYEYVILKMEKE